MRIRPLNTAAFLSFSLRHFVGCRVDFPPLVNSDFSGWVYLTSSEAKIEFKPVEPRNPWIDAFSSELGRQVLVVLS
jgi:hypothetical protein